jgi:hypothetical protein
MTTVFDDKIGKDLKVIKHNTLVEAQYNLSPVPHNLMTLAVVKVRNGEMNLPEHDRSGEVIISADEYAKIHGIDIKTAYKDLKHAVLELENSSIRCDAYYDFNANQGLTPDQRIDIAMNSDRYHSNVIIGTKPKHGNYVKMKLHIKLVDRVGYSEQGAFVYFRFSDDVMYLIENSSLDYTSYPYANTVDMNITPTKRLYELVCKWAKLGECKKSVDDWRHFFGLSNKYEKIAEFKRWVITPAITGVNKQGDFKLTLEQQKLGKTITHLIIKIKDKRPKENTDRDPDTIDLLDNKTDRERSKGDDLTPHNDTERQIIAEKNAYADQHGYNADRRQNLVRQGLTRYRQAEQEQQTRQEQEQADRQAQEQQDKERLELAQRQFEQILASDELIKLYIKNNYGSENNLQGIQRFYHQQGDYQGIFHCEKHKFEQLHHLRYLNLKFLD